VASDSSTTASSSAASPELFPVKVYPYRENVDELDKEEKSQIIRTLLKTLPAIREMQHYLQRSEGEARLKNWVERISPASFGVFRWIIASNRSCIVQVDEPQIDDNADKSPNKFQMKQKPQ